MLVLLDPKVPKVGGLEVLRAMRAEPRTRGVPVVVLASSNERQDIEDAYAAGANSHVRKAVGLAEFTDVMRRVAEHWLRWSEPPPSAKG